MYIYFQKHCVSISRAVLVGTVQSSTAPTHVCVKKDFMERLAQVNLSNVICNK